jgi:hypothetical protein
LALFLTADDRRITKKQTFTVHPQTAVPFRTHMAAFRLKAAWLETAPEFEPLGKRRRRE